MDADRHSMEASLKSDCVPSLRKLGFKGTFPNFYRDTDGFVALVNFQFFSSGGSFCVNLGYADPQRKNVSFQPSTEVKKLRVSQTKDKVRLGATAGGDRWFSFGRTSYKEYRDQPRSVEELAMTCSELLSSDGEKWWQAKRASQN